MVYGPTNDRARQDVGFRTRACQWPHGALHAMFPDTAEHCVRGDYASHGLVSAPRELHCRVVLQSLERAKAPPDCLPF